MPQTDDHFSVEILPGAAAVAASDWALLAGANRTEPKYNPFISHEFLTALENAGCVGPRTGWQPHFIKVLNANKKLVAVVPAYLKSHSQGEYVFDHGWADAFARAGGNYYPKLQISVPFTPATGPRLLTRVGDATGKDAAAIAIQSVVKEYGLSSAHVTFLEKEDATRLEQHGFLHRTDQQFHFLNKGYRDYADFLDTLASRKRKALRKERETALANGISIHRLTGIDLTEDVWDQFFAFYMDTGSRKWGQPYLNRKFFSLIGETMGGDIVLIMAKRNGRYIAGAINFVGSERIFGRNWGCVEDHPFLHFEVCYHQAIDYAIEHKLKVVEAGAQGEHKLARGYEPVTTHSAHYIAHPGLRCAVDDYLRHERLEIERVNALLGEHTPFRKGPLLTERQAMEE
ncbi:MAG: GNAT family N-acetyltransferase [Rhizobiaceae bacterium]